MKTLTDNTYANVVFKNIKKLNFKEQGHILKNKFDYATP